MSIHPKGPTEYYNVGKLSVYCKFCAALHFPKERHKCCSNGKVKFDDLPPPPYTLARVLDMKNPVGRKCNRSLVKMNSLFSMAATQSSQVHVPGRGPPTLKVRGGMTHTASAIKHNGTNAPRFGELYTMDSIVEATEARMANDRMSKGLNERVCFVRPIQSELFFS